MLDRTLGQANTTAQNPTQEAPVQQQAKILNPADNVQQQTFIPHEEIDMSQDIFALLADNSTDTFMAGDLTADLKVLKENVDTLLEVDKTVSVEVINDPQLLRLPVFVFYSNTANGLNAHVAMIESGMTSPLENKKYNVQGTYVELVTSASSLADKTLETVVSNHLARKRIGNVSKITTMNVPASSDLKSAVTARVIMSASKLAIGGGKMPIKAAHLNNKAVKVVANFSFTPGSTGVDAMGRPCAQDVSIRTSVRKVTGKDSGNKSGHGQGQDFVLSETKAILDYMFDESVANQRNHAMNPYGRAQAQPAYVPVLVGTEVSGIGSGAKSCEGVVAQMLGLYTLNALGNNREYKRLYLRNSAAGTQMDDLGAMGLEYDPFGEQAWVPKREVISTHGQATQDGSIPLDFMLDNYVVPNAIIALDVEDGGISAWVQDDLVKAAYGDLAAAKRVTDELDSFFGGNFSKHFGTNKLFIAKPSTIHLGYYNDAKTHAQQDVRSVGYMKVLNATDGAQDIMASFATVPGNNTPISLDSRKKVLDEICAFDQTAWGTRLYFNPALFAAINAAIVDSSVGVELENLDPLTYNAGRAGGLFNGDLFAHNDIGSAFYHGQQDQMGGAAQFNMFQPY